jgi:hypothetical protein
MKKVSLLLKVAFTFLFACLISFNLIVDNASATGQFSKTCDDINIEGSTLSATCQTIDGDYQETSINLDKYVGNLDGKLSWGDHDFSQTCENVAVAQSLKGEYQVAGKCKTKAGAYTQTELGLDARIANIDGNLQYE